MPSFIEWMKDVVHGVLIDPRTPKNIDRVHLCCRPSQLAIQFTRIKAYQNHFRVAKK